ncbi:MAG TPA: FtsX-like permease family protein [Pirellulaceae bacterium]|nr:FtsX-like permease family protein [Pirellulaceae bacterium]
MSLRRYSRRALLSRPGRTILTLLSIVIGVSSVVSVTIVADTTREAYKTMLATVRGHASLEVRASNSGPFAEEIVDKIAAVKGVSAAVATVKRESATTIGEGDEATRVRLQALGVDPAKDHLIRDLDVVAGRFVKEGDEVMLEADFAAQMNLKVGDTIGMTTPKSLPDDEWGPKPMKLVGLVKSKGAEALLQTGIVFMPLERAQLRFLGSGKINAVQIVTEKGADEEAVRTAVAALLPAGLEVQPPSDSAQMLQQTLLSTNQGLRLTTGFSLLLSGFIILNTFLMNVGERRRHLAITRAIGATRWQLGSMLIGEAFLLGLIGTVLGIGMGMLTAHYLNMGLSRLLDVSLPAMQLSVWPFLWAVVFGFVVSIVGALVPALRVIKVSPLEGMSRASTRDFSRPPAFHMVIGAVVAVVSGVLIYGGTVGYLPIIVPTFAALSLHLGIVLLFPLVLAPLSAMVDRMLILLSKAERSLALKQLLRHRGRTSLTVGVLFIAGSIGVAMASAILDNVQDLNDWRDSVIIGDYYVRAMIPDMATGKSADLPEELGPELEKVPNIAHLDRVKFTDGQIGDQNVMIIARDFRDRGRLPLALRQGDPNTVRQQLAAGEALISSVLVQKLGLNVGDEIELGTDTGTKKFRICGTVNEYMVGGLAVYFDWQVAVRELGITGVDGYAVRVEEGKQAEVEKSLAALCRKYGVLLSSKADISRSISRMSNGISGLNWGLVGLGFVVAAFGVVNTLSMNVLEQTRELGLLRIVAMTKEQVRRTIVAQAVIIGAVGLLPGVLFGYGVAYIMNLAMEPSFGRDIQFHHRPLMVAITFSVALLITLISAWVPAHRAANVDLATALHYE